MTGFTAAVISVERASSFCLSVIGFVVVAIVGRFTSGVGTVAASSELYVVPALHQ